MESQGTGHRLVASCRTVLEGTQAAVPSALPLLRHHTHLQALWSPEGEAAGRRREVRPKGKGYSAPDTEGDRGEH